MHQRLVACTATRFCLIVLFTVPGWNEQAAGDPAGWSSLALPPTFDLRQIECVTPIKKQLGGTCWTHGTMAAIESQLLISGFWKALDREHNLALSEYHLDWWNGFNKHNNE